MNTSGARHKPRYRLKATWLRSLLIMVCVALLSGPLSAITVDEVPNIHLKDARQYVTDPSAILSTAARDSINLMLGQLEKGSGIEVAVVMLPSIGNDDIFDFAHNLFRKWGIGKKKENNGLLVLFVMDQHKVRFTTGYGIEGIMTDAMSKRIQMQQMVPRFKEGNWDAGMVNGMRAAVSVLDGSMQPDAADEEGDDTAALIILAVMIVGTVLIIVFALSYTAKCPHCGKKGLQKVNEQKLKVSLGAGRSKMILRTTYKCKYCGRLVTKDEDINDGSGSCLATAAIVGSMLGGRGGGSTGGGFSGGSWGGGSTGGGGSTSGW